MKAPNEKLIELLFTRHSLQYCGSETVLYAPSTHEEHRNGYDAKFTGKDGCVELCLQFKTPNVTKDGFTVSIREHQHQTLLSYPRNSAFYVTHAFRTIAEIQKCQLQAIQAKDFLKYYIAIEAHTLGHRTNFVQYVRNSSSYPQFPKFKHAGEGKIRKARNTVSPSSWCDGISLIRKFKKGMVGCYVEFANARPGLRHPTFKDIRNEEHLPLFDGITNAVGMANRATYPLFQDDEEFSLPVMLRKYP